MPQQVRLRWRCLLSITAGEVAGRKVLEFRTANGGVLAAQAGRRVEDVIVLHVAEGRALRQGRTLCLACGICGPATADAGASIPAPFDSQA